MSSVLALIFCNPLSSNMLQTLRWKIGGFLYSLERESVGCLLLSSAHLLQERLEGNEAVIVSGVAQLLHKVLGVLAGLVHGEDIGLGQELLSLGASTSDLLDG